MRAVVSNACALHGTPPDLGSEIREQLSVTNPRWLDAKKYGRRKRVFLPRFLRFYQEDQDGALQVPRGFLSQVQQLAEEHGEPVDVQDNTRLLSEVDFDFRGSLRPYQIEAVEDVLSRPMGTLSAPTGSGKTLVALAAIAERRQPALIVVHTRELAEQWKDRAARFLDVSKPEIGFIGADRKDVGERLTVATVQSLYKCAHEVSPYIGFLLVDEAHRAPSRTFSEAVAAFDARFLLGLSATPWRRDRLSKLIYWHLGDLAHKVESEALRESGDLLRPEVVWRQTAFQTDLNPREQYSSMLSELTQDQARNELIAGDVAEVVSKDAGVVLVLSDRKAHVEALASLLEARGIRTATLTGDLSQKARTEALEAVTTGRVRVLVGTQQLVSEGLDFPALSALFLATPIRFDGRLIQSMGRVLRPAPGKERAVVFDYEDVNVGVLRNAARARARVYQSTQAVVRAAAS